jgi:hypothetical protein
VAAVAELATFKKLLRLMGLDMPTIVTGSWKDGHGEAIRSTRYFVIHMKPSEV